MKQGIYKGIRVLVRDHNSKQYYIEPDEPFDNTNHLMERLENAGFVEYQMHWYKLIQKDDSDFHAF